MGLFHIYCLDWTLKTNMMRKYESPFDLPPFILCILLLSTTLSHPLQPLILLSDCKPVPGLCNRYMQPCSYSCQPPKKWAAYFLLSASRHVCTVHRWSVRTPRRGDDVWKTAPIHKNRESASLLLFLSLLSFLSASSLPQRQAGWNRRVQLQREGDSMQGRRREIKQAAVELFWAWKLSKKQEKINYFESLSPANAVYSQPPSTRLLSTSLAMTGEPGGVTYIPCPQKNPVQGSLLLPLLSSPPPSLLQTAHHPAQSQKEWCKGGAPLGSVPFYCCFFGGGWFFFSPLHSVILMLTLNTDPPPSLHPLLVGWTVSPQHHQSKHPFLPHCYHSLPFSSRLWVTGSCLDPFLFYLLSAPWFHSAQLCFEAARKIFACVYLSAEERGCWHQGLPSAATTPRIALVNHGW